MLRVWGFLTQGPGTKITGHYSSRTHVKGEVENSHFSGLKRESDFYEVLKIMLSRRTNFKDNILFFENFVHAHNVYD